MVKTDQQLSQQAALLRSEASKLLHEDGLLDLLEAYGKACVIGSFTLDLMTWPDIDLSVQLPHERDISTFFTIGHEIATRFQVVKMSFSNQFIRADVPFDRGLYWGIRLLYGERTWKVDLWGYGKQDYQANLAAFERLKQRLSNADRNAILRIKDVCCQQDNYRVDVQSVEIYEAVSDVGIQTVDDFLSWRRGK